MSKVFIRLIIALGAACTTVGSAHSEFYSNMRGNTVETRQASSQAFAALAQLMSGLSILELGDAAAAKIQLTAASDLMRQNSKLFQALSEKNANVTLELKYPDALTELAQTLEVSADKIATVGDVLALTSQSLITTADVLDQFAAEPTPDRYTALRKSVENTLRTGDLSSKLLQ